MIGIVSNVNLENLGLIANEENISYFDPALLDSPDFTAHSFWEKCDQFLILLDINFGILKGGPITFDNYSFIEEWYQKQLQQLSELFKVHASKRFYITNVLFLENIVDSDLFWNSAEAKPIDDNVNDLISFCQRSHSNLVILNWRNFALNLGRERLYDEKYWYLARMPVRLEALKVIWHKFCQLEKQIRKGPKKVLCLDLDNTLWQGLAGEEGVQVGISEEGIGKIYRDFQRQIKKLKDLGILLAIASKNNEQDVLNVFNKSDQMILRLEDFAATRTNWQDKVSNLKALAEELNLNLDSFVFIDDSKVEREFVRENLPMIAVPEWPSELSALPYWFVTNVVNIYFPILHITNEDIKRSNSYLANKQRIKEQNNLPPEEFLRNLNMQVRISIDNQSHLKRNAQLLQKTNQFNLTNKRYTESDLIDFLENKEISIVDMFYSDKFGEEGIIACLLYNKTTSHIEAFVMSCRVIGRNVEYAILKKITELAKESGHNKITGELVVTERNVPAQNFYKNLTFKEINKGYFESEIEQLENYLTSFTEVISIE